MPTLWMKKLKDARSCSRYAAELGLVATWLSPQLLCPACERGAHQRVMGSSYSYRRDGFEQTRRVREVQEPREGGSWH